MTLPNTAAFLVASAALAWLSRRSLLRPLTHGFYRFLAWEAMLALLCLNWRRWFVQPLAPRQLLSWLLLCLSALLVAWGALLLRRARDEGASARPDETGLLEFERTTRLATTGIYRYIRHPLYASLLFLTWGIYLKRPTAGGTLLGVAATLFLYVTARLDERECRRHFGEAYADYVARTRMFVPYLF